MKMKKLFLMLILAFLVSSFAMATKLPSSLVKNLSDNHYRIIGVEENHTHSHPLFAVLVAKNDLSSVYFNDITLFIVKANGSYIAYPHIVEGGCNPTIAKYESISDDS